MRPRVAYLVSRFPKLSETFILDELVELRRLGVPIDLYALVEEGDCELQAEARPFVEELVAANRLGGAILGATLAWLWERPVAFLTLFGLVLRASWRAPRRLARSVAALLAAGLFARRMRREGVTHVHAHWATHPALMAWAIQRLTAIPYSFTLHADDLFVSQILLEPKLREAARIVTISQYNADFLHEHFADAVRGKLELVRCGVRSDAFTPAARQEREAARGGPLRVLCVARLEPKKGHRHLLEACGLLRQRGLEVECELVGEGALRAELEAQIGELGLASRVRMLGAARRERVRALLQEADVFVMSSVISTDGRRDGIPVALMEAMASCLPVVATRVSGVPELVEDGVTGRLVEPGDPRALADAIEALAGDPAAARELGRRARERVRADFDVGRNARRLHHILVGAAAPSERDSRAAGGASASPGPRALRPVPAEEPVEARREAVAASGGGAGER